MTTQDQISNGFRVSAQTVNAAPERKPQRMMPLSEHLETLDKLIAEINESIEHNRAIEEYARVGAQVCVREMVECARAASVEEWGE